MDNGASLVFDLALARSHVVRELDAELGVFHGLSLGDLALLRELQAAPGNRLRRVELAGRLGVTPSGIARQLGPLERIGLVGRESHARDARLALVTLTAAGARITEEALETAEHTAGRVLGALWSPPERERLATLLARVRS